MSYTVLARRYRSKDFDDLVGQEPIAQTLKNAIETNRVAHAYLFCGTRGVGKTSTARILAKALNCEKGPTPKPCGKCDRCLSIASGEDIDVIEIDGASNRGIDEIRNLRQNAIYRPNRSPYKIYIIDEVHMLTKEAFNALLKTLEEPPDHVKFIFATTESNKVPQTISSRCQEFSFRLIPTDEIAAQLTKILKAEKIKAGKEVIERVARAGRGSMRDALSLMDQLLAMGAESVSEEMVEYLLGEPAADQLLALTEAVADGDPSEALSRVDGLLAGGYAPEQFVVTLIEHLRRLMLLGIVGDECPFLDIGAGDRKQLAEQAGRFNPVTLVYMIQLLEQLRQSVRNSTTAARALIDATTVRLALADQFADTAELVERLGGGAADDDFVPPARRPAVAASKKKVTDASTAPAAAADQAEPAEEAPATAAAPANGNGALGDPLIDADTPLEQVAGEQLWKQVLDRISRARIGTLVGPLRDSRLLNADGNALKVAVHKEMQRVLASPQRQEQFERLLGELFSRRVRVQWTPLERAEAAAGEPAGNGSQAVAARRNAPSQDEMKEIFADPTFREMMEIFHVTITGVDRGGSAASGPSGGDPTGG